MLIFKRETQKALCLYAQAAYPEECCGIILGKRKGEERIAYQAVPTRNMSGSKQKETHFAIDPFEIAKIELLAERERLEIIGFYHSHPNYEAVASDTDVLYMMEEYSYPIISVRNGICTRIVSFERNTRASTEIREEKIMIQGE